MYACLATATDDLSLTKSIERVVNEIGLDLRRVENEDGSTVNLQPKARQAVRSARVFIAALARQSLQASSILYGIGIAQSGRVPVVVVGDDLAPLSLQGPMLSDIPKENIFLRTSPEFPTDLATRLLELASTAPAIGDAADSKAAKGRAFDVFLSYSNKDGKYANELSKFLRQHNVTFWAFDRSRREFDVDFADEIETAIRKSSAFIAVLTPNWRPSPWVQDEFKFARRIGMRQFVLEFEKTEPILILSSLIAIDCQTNPLDGFHMMLARLDEILAERA